MSLVRPGTARYEVYLLARRGVPECEIFERMKDRMKAGSLREAVLITGRRLRDERAAVSRRSARRIGEWNGEGIYEFAPGHVARERHLKALGVRVDG